VLDACLPPAKPWYVSTCSRRVHPVVQLNQTPKYFPASRLLVASPDLGQRQQEYRCSHPKITAYPVAVGQPDRGYDCQHKSKRRQRHQPRIAPSPIDDLSIEALQMFTEHGLIIAPADR
jgi:hypothetical protein